MEEFVKLLDDYGLELDFIYKDDKDHLEDDLKFMKNRSKKEDAFLGLLDVLGELMIKVVDY